jgi:nicotinate phosphoribosyltransferase
MTVLEATRSFDSQSTTAGASTALLTDHYELTALDAALQAGIGQCEATFELFPRRLGKGRRFGVVAGTARALEAVVDFRFDDADLAWLESRGFLSPAALEFCANYRFSGDIDGYAEGELFFPCSPLLTVTSTFAEALILETVLLSIMNDDAAVASAAARMRIAAGDRKLIEAGARRKNEWAAPAASRAAYIAGFDVVTNLEAGRRWGIPTAGTTMHAFVLAFPDERAAFDAQVARFGCDSTFLVDTFDISGGIANALAACAAVGGVPARIRIDSGDRAAEAVRGRAQLDAADARATEIMLSGDLDEHRMLGLADAPVDWLEAGTSVVTGSGVPTGGFVYKLVAIADRSDPRGYQRPVAKRAANKASAGGRKVATRLLDSDGFAYEEHVVARAVTPTQMSDGPFSRHLQVPLMRRGEIVADTSVATARAHCAAALAELRPAALDLSPGRPALDATPTP